MISYSLGAYTLTPTQLARIHSVVEQAYLAKEGLNRKFPKAVIQGPRFYGGQRDTGLYTRKGYQQLRLFLGHIRNADTPGEMIRQENEFLQLTAGIRDPILGSKSSHKWLEWVEETWVTDVKLFLLGIAAGILLKSQWHQQIQREHDSFLMDYIPEECDKKTSQQINRCRVFLQALTVADITTSDGKQIDRSYLNGKINEAYSSVLTCPHKRDIHKKGWIQWEKFIRDALCYKGTDLLKTSLGQWLNGNGHNTWNFFQHPKTNWLYEQRQKNGKIK